MSERTTCPKCRATSGDDWRQCKGECPMPGSPVYRDPAAEPPIPTGFVEVTKDRFFELLKAETRDVMPTTEAPKHSWWRVVATREAWGWTAPGWQNPSAHRNLYAVAARYVKEPT